MQNDAKIILTGFMGVGKSTVAKHLAGLLGTERVDLDVEIERSENRSIAEIIESEGVDRFRQIESDVLEAVLAGGPRVVALGGGAWTIEENRRRIKESGFISVWLETDFDHCWLNIVNSKRVRPLARDKAGTKRLFEERRRVYCLADWHFIVRPDLNSHAVARRIAEDIFSLTFD